MAQVEPAYRRLAERATYQYTNAIKRNDRPELVAYLRENKEAWQLIDNVLTMFCMTIKTLGTSDRAAEMMQLMASNALYNRQLIPPADESPTETSHSTAPSRSRSSMAPSRS